MSDGHAAPFPSPDSGQSETLRIPLVPQNKQQDEQQEQLEEVNLNEDKEEGQGEIKNSKFVPMEPILPLGAAPGEVRQYKIRPDSLDLSSLSISKPNIETKTQTEDEESDVNASDLQITKAEK